MFYVCFIITMKQKLTVGTHKKIDRNLGISLQKIIISQKKGARKETKELQNSHDTANNIAK